MTVIRLQIWVAEFERAATVDMRGFSIVVECSRGSVEHLEALICPDCHQKMVWYRSDLLREFDSVAHFFQCPNCHRTDLIKTPFKEPPQPILKREATVSLVPETRADENRPICENCNQEMCLLATKPVDNGKELRTFECSECATSQTIIT